MARLKLIFSCLAAYFVPYAFGCIVLFGTFVNFIPLYIPIGIFAILRNCNNGNIDWVIATYIDKREIINEDFREDIQELIRTNRLDEWS